MRQYFRLVILSCAAALAFEDEGVATPPPFDIRDVKQVRLWVRGLPSRKECRYLRRMGAKVFPAYEAILADPNSTADEVGAVIGTVRETEAGRRGFVKYALARLLDKHAHVRHHAVDLLRHIGSPAEASALIALLSDEDRSTITYAASRALAAIGGPNEVLAMDVWVRGVCHRDHPGIHKYVQEQRDELRKRLDGANDPRKRAQTIRESWRNLDIADPRGFFVVQRAVRQLRIFGSETVPFLKDHLHPIPAATQKQHEQLLVDLDSDSFERREKATRELSRGIVAESVLEKRLAKHPSLELRRRLEAILEDLADWKRKNRELAQQVRAVWVLEEIGTPAAQALLEKLAGGAASALLTQKAKGALERLKKYERDEGLRQSNQPPG